MAPGGALQRASRGGGPQWRRQLGAHPLAIMAVEGEATQLLPAPAGDAVWVSQHHDSLFALPAGADAVALPAAEPGLLVRRGRHMPVLAQMLRLLGCCPRPSQRALGPANAPSTQPTRPWCVPLRLRACAGRAAGAPAAACWGERAELRGRRAAGAERQRAQLPAGSTSPPGQGGQPQPCWGHLAGSHLHRCVQEFPLRSAPRVWSVSCICYGWQPT